MLNLLIEHSSQILHKKYPDFQSELTGENLFPLSKSKNLEQQGCKWKNDYIIYSQPIRKNRHLTRFLQNNPVKLEEWNAKVLIDPDRLGDKQERGAIMEDHWWGPKWKTDLYDGEAFVTIHGNGETHGPWIDKTEFFREKRNDEVHLHIEELIPLRGGIMWNKASINRYTLGYFTRYAHSIFHNRTCIHLDIGYREYPNKNTFKKRHQDDTFNLKYVNKLKDITERYKFLRLDSPKGIEKVEEVIGLSFLTNPYIHEFFEKRQSKDLEQVVKTRTFLIDRSLAN